MPSWPVSEVPGCHPEAPLARIHADLASSTQSLVWTEKLRALGMVITVIKTHVQTTLLMDPLSHGVHCEIVKMFSNWTNTSPETLQLLQWHIIMYSTWQNSSSLMHTAKHSFDFWWLLISYYMQLQHVDGVTYASMNYLPWYSTNSSYPPQ